MNCCRRFGAGWEERCNYKTRAQSALPVGPSTYTLAPRVNWTGWFAIFVNWLTVKLIGTVH